MSDDAIVDSVIQRIQDRSRAGMVKFGKPMTRTDRTTVQWIDDAIEEALDLAVYLTRVKSDLEVSDAVIGNLVKVTTKNKIVNKREWLIR